MAQEKQETPAMKLFIIDRYGNIEIAKTSLIQSLKELDSSTGSVTKAFQKLNDEILGIFGPEIRAHARYVKRMERIKATPKRNRKRRQ